MNTISKQCNTCGDVKSLDEYHRSNREKDGRSYKCKACVAAYDAEHRSAYRSANAEKIAARMASYNAARLATAAESYRKGNREVNREWLAKEATYAAAHDRTKAAFGRASAHPCESADCDRQASEWALSVTRGAHVREAAVFDRRDGSSRVIKYSLDPRDYRPLCHGCHTQLDRNGVDVFKLAA